MENMAAFLGSANQLSRLLERGKSINGDVSMIKDLVGNLLRSGLLNITRFMSNKREVNFFQFPPEVERKSAIDSLA